MQYEDLPRPKHSLQNSISVEVSRADRKFGENPPFPVAEIRDAAATVEAVWSPHPPPQISLILVWDSSCSLWACSARVLVVTCVFLCVSTCAQGVFWQLRPWDALQPNPKRVFLSSSSCEGMKTMHSLDLCIEGQTLNAVMCLSLPPLWRTLTVTGEATTVDCSNTTSLFTEQTTTQTFTFVRYFFTCETEKSADVSWWSVFDF